MQDIESTVAWYDRQRGGLALEFIQELRAAYDRIVEHPLVYQDLRGGIRRAMLRRFPHAVYFVVEDDVIVVLAVLHAGRDPAEWQRRRV